MRKMPTTSIRELSQKAASELFRAEKAYSERMIELHPIGSYWLCNHGTRGWYEVEIKGFVFSRGFLVENIHTMKQKYVHWSSLSRPEERQG